MPAFICGALQRVLRVRCTYGSTSLAHTGQVIVNLGRNIPCEAVAGERRVLHLVLQPRQHFTDAAPGISGC